MINASLRIFKNKSKPGSCAHALLNSLAGSQSLFSGKRLNLFSSAVQDQVDPDIETRILNITENFLKDIKYAKSYRLHPRASITSLGLDSLDAIDLIIEIEEQLGFDISNEDAENRIKTVHDACVVFTEYSRNLQTSTLKITPN
jgi:acyl carrier protein